MCIFFSIPLDYNKITITLLIVINYYATHIFFSLYDKKKTNLKLNTYK